MYKLTAIISILLVILSYNSYSQNFNYDIKYQRLEFEVDPAIRYITGKITTYFVSNENNLDEISFNLQKQLIIDSVLFQNEKISFNHKKNIVTINLPTKSQKGNLDSISVYYQGIPGSSGWGSFIISKHNNVPIMWTLSEPYGAETWMPCKQTLNDKADSIDMFVTAPKQYKVAGNGLLISETLKNDTLKITHWKHRYPITTYLIAFAVTNYASYYDYAQINDSINLPVLEMVYPEDSADIRLQSPDIINTLKFYSDSFMIYPFANEKYGQAQFGWGGGMEHQTMTFIHNFDHDLTAHELAHQWFGDYITCGSWHDIWLNEGFAVYLEGLTAEQGLAPYTWEDWKSITMYQATSVNCGSVYVEDTTSVRRIFSYPLTYMKGGMILHQLRGQIGDKAFFDGIREYLADTNLAYAYARVDDLKKHFENTSNCDLTDYFNTWYYGEGFPIYDVDYWQEKDNKIYIKINQTQSCPSVDFFSLKLPFRISGIISDTTIWLENTENNQIFTVNYNQKLINILFDPENWIVSNQKNVHKALNINKLSVNLIPNPSKNEFTVVFPFETTVKTYEILDTTGKIYTFETPNKHYNKLLIQTNNLNAGQYLLYIETSDGNIVKNFIKE